MSSDLNAAVYINKVYFSYSNLSILNGINLNVEKGRIYGLLGSSGCGKTTLLKCILSRLKPKSGQILIFGSTPGSKESQIPGAGVGFMPQELGLYMNFTIEETLKYFAKIFSMNETQVEQQIDALINLLQLPNKNKLVEKLSCGQQRRVSLAATLIHSPPLLILDEPTVGVDAVLRKSIWKHLQTLCASGHTIMITTHYIEEARSASMIGFMRDGKILAEDNPDELMKRYEETNLEDTLLKICEQNNIIKTDDDDEYNGLQGQINETFSINDEMGANQIVNESNHPFVEGNNETFHLKRNLKDYGKNESNNICNDIEFDVKVFQKEPTSGASKSTFGGRLNALFYKNLLRMKKTLLLHIFYTFEPILFLLLVILCIGSGPKDLPLGINNMENKNSSVNNLGKLFVDCIDNKTFNIINYESFDAGYKDVEDGKIWALIEISEHFSQALRLRKIYGSDIDNETLYESQLHVYIDMSNQIISFYIKKSLYEAIQSFAEYLYHENNMNSDFMKSPLVFEDPPVYGKYEETSKDFVLPGMFVLIITYATSNVLCHIILEERRDGLIERSIVAGVTAFEFMLSQVLIQTIFMLIQVLFLIIFCFSFLQLPNEGSLSLLSFFIFSQGLIGIMLGILISSISKDVAFSSMICVCVFAVYLTAGGVYWPIENSPYVLQWFSTLLPSTVPVNSMRNIMFRGWGIHYFQVYIGFIVTYIWLFIFIVVSVLALKTNF